MKVLIVGATGFIGKRLVGRLLSEGFELVCTGRSLEKLSCYSGKIKSIYLDIRNRKRVGEILRKEKPKLVFHCAAQTSNRSLRFLRQVNVEGTKNIFDACLEGKVERIIYLSSISVIAGNKCEFYNDDLPYRARNRYGKSKIEAEKLACEYRGKGVKIAILRPSLVYGEGDYHKVSWMIRLISKRLVPMLGNGGNKFSFTYIENLIDVMMIAVFEQAAYEGTYIVADKEVMSLRDLFLYIAKLLEVKKPWFLPSWVIFIFLACPFVRPKVKVLLNNNICSIDNMRNQLGYIPKVSLYKGFKRTVEEHEKRYELRLND